MRSDARRISPGPWNAPLRWLTRPSNGTPYGLSASLFTRDLTAAMKYIPRIHAGLVRVNAEFTYTTGQMTRLRELLDGWFAGGHAELSVADFRGLTGASRKFVVPLLEHCDRAGWTVRVEDVRRKG